MKVTRRGLRFEIVTSLVLLVTAAAGFMGLMVFRYAQQEMIALKIEMGLILARVAEEGLNPDQPAESLAPLIQTLAERGFESMVIVDRSNMVLAHTGSSPDLRHPTRISLELAMTTLEVQSQWRLSGIYPLNREPFLDLAIPLTRDLKVIGAIGLHSSLAQLNQAWRRTVNIIIGYLLLDIIVMVVFGSYILTRRMVTPLTQMVDRIEDLAEGRFNPVVTKQSTGDEIGRLEEAFESMAGRLIESRARLEENLASLKEAQEGLIRTEKMAGVGRLSAGLAHELGNPLASVLGFVHLLSDETVGPAERNEYLARMEDEINRMDEIIRGLLDFARPVTATPGPVDLNEIVNTAVALASVHKWVKSLEIDLHLRDDLPQARAETNRMIQVILNLVDNAGQAMSGRGKLTLSTGGDHDHVYIQIADTGPGISEEHIEHIFEPFFTLKEPGQGTGLGLSVSLGIIESFGGRIDVQSRPGEGAVFKVVLPVNEESVRT